MKLLELLRRSDSRYRRGLGFFFFAYFFVQLNYPLVRASNTTFFLEAYGAKSTPQAIVFSVLFLSLSILISNWFQARFSVQKVLLGVSSFTAITFLITTYLLESGIKEFAFFQYVWKEIYIVMQVHLLLAYANNFFVKEDFKILIGPLGAFASLGGILGGLMTSSISDALGTIPVMWTGIFFVLAPAVFFFFTPTLRREAPGVSHVSPLASLKGDKVMRYVLVIAAIVALTQFIINIADFRFHIEFEQAITDSGQRTSYLGQIYAMVNVLTLVFQLFLLPYLLPRVSERNYHFFIPISYLICVGALMGGTTVGLLPVAALYTYFKASDYSLFTAGKEILYQPLGQWQKYGAKYLTDMLVYRLAKALIAAVLIYLQSSLILNVLMLIFLFIWIVLVSELFKLHKKLF